MDLKKINDENSVTKINGFKIILKEHVLSILTASKNVINGIRRIGSL